MNSVPAWQAQNYYPSSQCCIKVSVTLCLLQAPMSFDSYSVWFSAMFNLKIPQPVQRYIAETRTTLAYTNSVIPLPVIMHLAVPKRPRETKVFIQCETMYQALHFPSFVPRFDHQSR